MKFIVLFIRNEQNQRILYRKIQFKYIPKSITLNQKTYLVNWEQPLFIDKKLNRVYVLDIFTGNQIITTENKNDINPNDLDTIISGNFIREFVKSANEDFRTKVIWCILGLIIGFLAGALIINMVMQEQINSMLENQQPPVVTLINLLRIFSR